MANYSEVDIVNMALAMLGANTIRSLNEDNKRARLASIFYPMIRDYVLARFDWPFAKKFETLKMFEADTDREMRALIDTEVPDGWYPYAKPADCLAPRDVHPIGSREKWIVVRNAILLRRQPDTEPKLWYTAECENTTKFSMQFIYILSLGLASKLASSVAVNVDMAESIVQQWQIEQAIGFGDDANIGEEPDPDGNARLDTFNEPDMAGYNYIPPFGGVDFNNT